MNELQVFTNSEFGSVRTVSIDGEPHFVGKDVAEILGYNNTKDAIATHVDEEDRLVIQRSENTTFAIPNRGLIVINESGLYSLILGSKLPTAKKFKRWVTAEVLPAIRKHGLYGIDEILADPDIAIRALTALKEERARARALEDTVEEQGNMLAVQNQQIAEMQPKVSYYDIVLNCKDLVAISVIAKDYGWSAKKLNRYLSKKGVQFKQGKIWLLYQKYAEKGYTSTKTYNTVGSAFGATDSEGDAHNHVHTYWTQSGRLFIYELLKQDGIVPLVERECVA